MINYRQLIVKEAREWIGTPYKHWEGVKGCGADCGLFVMKVYDEVGLTKFTKPPFYPLDWAFHNPVGEMFEQVVLAHDCKEIPKEEAGLGDIILYQFGKCMSHASIIVEDNKIIHSEINIGVKLSNRNTSEWKKRERKYYTWVEQLEG
jgi:cell wall-associated NlpC family hydrolase